jgi:hypothetical protein
MSAGPPDDLGPLLVALVEKVGLLRRDLQHKGDLDPYAARITRIEQKILALADHLEGTNPALAKEIRTAWSLPARSLAFRNAEHKKD